MSKTSHFCFNLLLILGMYFGAVTLSFAQDAVTPLDSKLPDGELSVVLPPAGGTKLGKYSVWLPDGYNDEANAKRTYPVLLIDLATGESFRRFKQVGPWVKRNKWICVMPHDVKNGAYDVIDRQYSVIFPDLKNRFRMTPHCGIMTGHSGGSRRSTRYGNANQDIFGGIINNGGVGSLNGAPHCSDPKMMVMVFAGVGDFNIAEIEDAMNHLDPNRCQIRLFDGGHSLGPVPVQNEAMDWMAAGLLANFGQPEPVLDLMTLLKTGIESSESQLKQYVMKTRYLSLFGSQRAFQKDEELKAIAEQYQADLKELGEDKDFKVELEAMTALQTIRMQYALQIGKSLDWTVGSLTPESKYGKKVISSTANARGRALADLETLSKRYPESAAAKESQEDVKTLESFTKWWTGKGNKTKPKGKKGKKK